MFIEDVVLLTAMGPPGGGRTNITARYNNYIIIIKLLYNNYIIII